MTQKQSLLARAALFVFGLALIAAAFAIFSPEGELDSSRVFVRVNVFLLYTVFFFPFFFPNVRTSNAAEKSPSLVLLWLAILSFEAAGIVLSFCVAFASLSVKVAGIVEAAVFFVCAIAVYFGCFASSHVMNVARNETESFSRIKPIRAALEDLCAKASALDGEFAAEKKRVDSLAESVRYLSPLQTPEASALEEQILEAVGHLDVALQSDRSALGEILSSIETLVARRKRLMH